MLIRICILERLLYLIASTHSMPQTSEIPQNKSIQFAHVWFGQDKEDQGQSFVIFGQFFFVRIFAKNCSRFPLSTAPENGQIGQISVSASKQKPPKIDQFFQAFGFKCTTLDPPRNC
ncbi:hypothetical protein L596_013067 [Steinernema carpocapsae]|uniref:Uncharacterized protein n=1 Tax=Steinernema carpocapsae TaxID=34508 RepID=A0A4V6A4Z5_STECR|nr:hypothetical protein L596_013067 [Steinernema carpocapsae]